MVLQSIKKALEQGDDGVKVASQGVTKGYRLTRKGFGLAKKRILEIKGQKARKVLYKNT
ncbi:hypothetical protein ACT7C1_24460 [Bacillus paranthracis]